MSASAQAGAHLSAGNARLRNDPPAAVDDLVAAAVLEPSWPETWNSMGALVLALANAARAEPCFARSLRLDPNRAASWLNAALSGGAFAHCALRFAAALALEPDLASAWYNLANGLLPVGLSESAVAAAARASALDPGPNDAYSNWLMTLHYPQRISAADIAAAHRRFGTFFASVPASPSHPPEQRLRIGYVSPDFGQHSIASFLPALIEAHDAEITLYSNRRAEDALTARYRALATRFRPILALNDVKAARLIAEDEIDVLVDLAGHTGGGRLGLFAQRPAPIQATWLGYPDTTGMRAIDIRITDLIADPPGAESSAQEILARIPGGFLSYRGPAIETAPPPCLANGFVTFGSFNNLAKLTTDHAAAMAEILAAVPRSRLILKARAFVDPTVRGLWLGRFEAAGCDPSRISLRDWLDRTEDHLAAYRDVDVALDSFPYAGTTTTIEALWMGVPVVSRTGDRHAARVGKSILARVGLDDLAVPGRDEFVAAAVHLAANRERLLDLRRSLRDRIRSGSLGDPRRLARAFETLFADLLEARRQGAPLKSIAARTR